MQPPPARRILGHHATRLFPPPILCPTDTEPPPRGACMSCGAKRQKWRQKHIRFRTLSDTLPPQPVALPTALPEYPLPDLTPWQSGNCGIAGVQHFESGQPGPHAVVTAIMHGNEPCGAYALDTLLQEGARPRLGRMSFIFLNLQAYASFTPAKPALARYVEEDMNRLWRPEFIRSAHSSYEMRRVREVLPVIETADILLDLHSMLWPGEPLFLVNPPERNIRLATLLAQAQPNCPAVVRDEGHDDGTRLIDYKRFSSSRNLARACLLEAGQHWRQSTAQQALLCTRLFLAHAGMLPYPDTTQQTTGGAVLNATVTDCITAETATFRFRQPFASGTIIAQAGTLIARDGPDEIRTPYDNCMLVMPNLRPRRRHTAVRLARPDDPAA